MQSLCEGLTEGPHQEAGQSSPGQSLPGQVLRPRRTREGHRTLHHHRIRRQLVRRRIRHHILAAAGVYGQLADPDRSRIRVHTRQREVAQLTP